MLLKPAAIYIPNFQDQRQSKPSGHRYFFIPANSLHSNVGLLRPLIVYVHDTGQCYCSYLRYCKALAYSADICQPQFLL